MHQDPQKSLFIITSGHSITSLLTCQVYDMNILFPLADHHLHLPGSFLYLYFLFGLKYTYPWSFQYHCWWRWPHQWHKDKNNRHIFFIAKKMIERVRCHNFGGSVRFITIYSGKSNKLSNLSNVALQSLKYMSIDSCRGDKFLLGQICAVAWQICVNCDWCNQYCSQSRTVRGTKNRRIHSCKCPALPTMHPLEPSKAF